MMDAGVVDKVVGIAVVDVGPVGNVDCVGVVSVDARGVFVDYAIDVGCIAVVIGIVVVGICVDVVIVVFPVCNHNGVGVGIVVRAVVAANDVVIVVVVCCLWYCWCHVRCCRCSCLRC